MMTFRYMLLFFPIIFALNGCIGKSVEVIQPNHFNALSKNIGNELIKRDITNEPDSWLNFYSSEDTNHYADIIFQKLPPAIIFENNVNRENLPSFSSNMTSYYSVEISNNYFTVMSKTQTITVNMIAKADWDSDEIQDWIISCFVKTNNSPATRDYTIIILDPENTFKPYVVGVNECIGTICTQYQFYDMENSAKGKFNTFNSSVPVDTLPGLRNVTMPPSISTQNTNNINEKELPR